MANEVEITVSVDNKTKDGLDGVDKGLKGIGEQAEQSSEKIVKGFERARDAQGRWVKDGEAGVTRTKQSFNDLDGVWSKVSAAASAFGSAFTKNLDGASSNVADFVAKVGTMGFTLAASEAAGTAASGGLNLVVSAVGALVAALPLALGMFAALAPALLAAGGAAGAAATLFAGAGIALATLKIGFGGIGGALAAYGKQTAGAGKAASDGGEAAYQAARRIKAAEQSLTQAKQAEADAAKAVNQARADEVDRLRELDLALRGQTISQEEAAQALVEAKEKNLRAQQAGSDWEKAEAKNAVDRAQFQYDSVSEKLEDLTAEKKKADKDGIEGSDQVQAALKRQTQAHQATLNAQDQLADAHHKVATAAAGAAGGVNAFNEAMKKLSPNARSLVYALIDIDKRFQGIKTRVQDRFLDGAAVAVTDLADKWLPHLDDILGDMADHLNHFGKNLLKALGDSEFIKNIQRAGKATGGFIDDLSDATDDFIDAFGRLAGHSGPVLKTIGGLIKGIFEWFDKWIKRADASGALDSFMQDAADTLQQIFDIGKLVFKIIGQLIEIIFPSSKGSADSIFDSVQNGLQAVSDWLGNPKNAKDVKAFVDTVGDFLKWLMKDGVPAVIWFIQANADLARGVKRAITDVTNFTKSLQRGLGGALDWVIDKGNSLISWFRALPGRISKAVGGAFNGLKEAFRDAINWIIWKWNGLQFTIGGGSFLGMPVPSASFGTPNIPYLATGGVAGGLAMVGERGRELVRLPQGSTVIPNGTTEGMMSKAASGGGTTVLHIERSGDSLVDVLIEALAGKIRKKGGNVQVVLGTRGAVTT